MARFDRQGRYLFVNAAIERATGCRPADLIGRTHAATGMPAALCAHWDAMLAWVFATGESARDHFEYPSPDGPRSFHALLVPERADDAPAGPVVSVLVITRDVTEDRRAAALTREVETRRHAEAALREREARLAAVFDGAVIGMALVDRTGHTIRSNAALRTMLGYSADELAALPFSAFTHPEDVAADEALFAELLAGTRDGYQVEKRYHRKDGSLLTGRVSASIVRDETGAVRYAVGMLEDVTERVRTEASLATDHAHLARLVETQQAIATAGLDLDRALAVVVERARELTGADSAVVEMVEGEELVYRAASGAAAAFIGLRLRVATSLSGRCVRDGTGTLLRCDDAEHDPRVDAAACRRVGARSMLVAPLRTDAGVLGVLKVSSPEPAAFGRRHEAALQLLAGLVAAALGNATQYEAMQSLVRALEVTEARSREILETIRTPAICLDTRGHVTFANDAFLSLTGGPTTRRWAATTSRASSPRARRPPRSSGRPSGRTRRARCRRTTRTSC
jgi:PAS domain S-box-containing protein